MVKIINTLNFIYKINYDSELFSENYIFRFFQCFKQLKIDN